MYTKLKTNQFRTMKQSNNFTASAKTIITRRNNKINKAPQTKTKMRGHIYNIVLSSHVVDMMTMMMNNN